MSHPHIVKPIPIPGFSPISSQNFPSLPLQKNLMPPLWRRKGGGGVIIWVDYECFVWYCKNGMSGKNMVQLWFKMLSTNLKSSISLEGISRSQDILQGNNHQRKVVAKTTIFVWVWPYDSLVYSDLSILSPSVPLEGINWYLMFFHLCLSSNQIAGFIGHQYLQKDSHDFINIFFFFFFFLEVVVEHLRQIFLIGFWPVIKRS